jgi:ubiquinone biosynthesis protein Coq4
MFLANLRDRFVKHLIGDYVPVLNLWRNPEPWPPLETLRDFPPGSLGREVAEYLSERGLPFKVRYENHDAIHAILGYDTTTRGELELQAFLRANRNASSAGHILFVLGGALLPEHWKAMRRAYRRGLRARSIEEPRLPHRLLEPLAEVRAGLGA